MLNNMERFFWLAIVASCLTILGCSLSLSPLSRRSVAFGGAASRAIHDSSNAYNTVERTTYSAGVSNLILDFDKTGFDRNKIKPFLPAHDLQVRQEVLRGIQAYADNLTQVAGAQGFGSLDQQTAVLSRSLVALSSNGELQKLTPGVSETEAKGIAVAVDVLAKVLIERKRRRELPGIIKKMQPVLEELCGLLEEDLGDRSIEGRAGHGLRSQLWNEYDQLIGNQTDYIAVNNVRLTPAERSVEIAKLPLLVAQQQNADAALSSTQRALHDLVETHRAILLPQQSSTFQSHLNELIQDGQQIGQFYSSLR